MRGIAVIGGGSFNNSSLPKVSVKPVPVIAGARYDWAADNTRLGATQDWWEQRQGGRLTSTHESGRWPTSMQATNRYLAFDGINDMLEGMVDLTGEKTLVVIGRFPEPANNQFMVTSGAGGGAHNLYINASGTYAFNNGSSITSTKTADNYWHCFIIVTKGNGSVLHIDGQEWTANLPASAASMLRLGATSSEFFKSDISRVAVLPYAADAYERASIRAIMKAHYSLF
ncbi:hypothetical protein [Arthrobacter sp. G119Y2]|uniref:hypothetical protein n=1 Tax=Arthrobacter sp. G119Y2 TaxID=3134965 RepID=UPI003119586A